MRWLMVLATLLSTVALAANPQVTLDTSKGEIVLELYPDKAPASVANFLTYVQDGFYNGTVFHRIIPNFMIQGGGFDQQYQKKDTRDAIQNEADNGLANDRGTIAMARTSDPHSATAQFFINTVDNTPLNHTGKNPRGWGYAVFGKVIKGMDVVDAISATPTGLGKLQGYPARDVPTTPVVIKSATLVTPAP
jgi:peptidyl-prolyl cis-trans isomerase A (cyclophilin A)/peptidyl-prolyl cis-trans isomerase B (cyclophilin B)